MIIENKTKRLLREGRLALGLALRHSRTVEIAQVASACGFDWLFIDCEHSAMTVDTAAQLSSASLGFGVTPIVRAPGIEHHHSTRALDNSAQGVVIPHVETAAEARTIAGFTRFPPLGHRSVGGPLAQTNFSNQPLADTMRLVNEETLVVAMIESPAGVDAAESIAAVPGIDVLFIGTNDLCAEMGIPGQFDHARVEDAYAKVIAACRKHGKFAGMGGVYAPALMQKFIAMGVQFILAGSELGFLMVGAKERAGALRALDPKR
jgi:2-keto-3-deoxy-L-rhamnonate aldolase RhmA